MSDSMSVGSGDVRDFNVDFEGSEDFSYDFDEAIAPVGFEPVPAGEYHVLLTDVSVEPTSTGGKMLNVTLQVQSGPKGSPQDGQFENRLIFDRWVMPNKGKQEPEKFRKTLGFLQQRVEALTKEEVRGSFQLKPKELLGQDCSVYVTVKQDKDEHGNPYPPKNEVSRYINPLAKKNAGQPTPQAPGVAPTGTQAADNSGATPQTASSFQL